MGVRVRVCVPSMFCGFGVDVVTHRCWFEDSSSGCGFHEVSFPRTACMLILNDLTNRNLQSNTIFLSVRLFLSCGTRTKFGCHTTFMIPTSLPHACTFLEVSFFCCRRHISHGHTSVAFSFPLRRVSPQSLQFLAE